MNLKKGFASLLALSLILGGCSSKETEEEPETQEVEEEVRDYDFYIGKEQSDTNSLYLKNDSDKTITLFQIKENDEKEFGQNLFNGKEFEDAQVLLWFVTDPASYEEDGTEMDGYYDINLRDEEETDYVLHNVQPENMNLDKDVELHFDEEEDLFYLIYEDKDEKEVNTLEDEKKIANEEKEAAEKEAAEADAAAQTEEETEQESTANNSSSSYQSSTSSNSGYTQPSTSQSGNTQTTTPSYDIVTSDQSSDPSAGLTNTWDVPSTGTEDSEGCLSGSD
jgi:hypothetical protein